MGFLKFYKKNKKNNNAQTLPKVDKINITEHADVTVCSEYNSPIADSFMGVGSSISNITQSSLSEEIFNELPLSGKSECYTSSSASSSDYSEVTLNKSIRHSLSLKPNCTPPSIQDKKIWRQSNISTLNDSVLSTVSNYQYLYDNSIELDKEIPSGNNAAPKANYYRKRLSIMPDLFVNTKLPTSSTTTLVNSPRSQNNGIPHVGKPVAGKTALNDISTASYNTSKPRANHHTPKTTSSSSPVNQEFIIDRMKERHRQEYRRSMQWSPTTSDSGNSQAFNIHKSRPHQHQSKSHPTSIKQSLIPFINKKNQVNKITPTLVILGNAPVTNNQCYANTKPFISLNPIQEQCYSLQTFAVPVSNVVQQENSMNYPAQQRQYIQHRPKIKSNTGTFGFNAKNLTSARQQHKARAPIYQEINKDSMLLKDNAAHLSQNKSMSVPNLAQLLTDRKPGGNNLSERV